MDYPIMKRFALTSVALVLFCIVADAQKTVITTKEFSDTQARMLEVTAKSYVRPLVVDLNVVGERTTFSKQYTRTDVEVAMGGNLDNLRSRAIYDATDKLNCDAIVAATFKIELSQDGTCYNLEMKGFPANFMQSSWHPMNEKDYEWIKVDKSVTPLDKTNDPDRAGAVIKNVKK